MNIVSVNPTKVTSTLNGIEQRIASTGQYFKFVGVYSNLEQANQRAVFAHIQSQAGPLNSFTISLPTYLGNSTAGFSGTLTAVTASVNAVTVTATASSNNTAVLKAGDLIKFSSHNKIYTVTNNVTSGGSGSCSINIFPALKQGITSNTITHRSVQPTVRYATDNAEFSLGADQFTTFTLEFIEVL
jgi:hypothetical protein